MKKCLVAITVALLAAFATPALAVTDPYMEVPADHWTHDAISQLAARSISREFWDGTFRGDQPMTRIELATVIARYLSVIDMTKASRLNVEILKRLVVEFKDELDVLGVRVDHIEMTFAAFSNRRLHSGPRRRGSWVMVMDIDMEDDYADACD